jgi:hypothetical protein
MDIDSLSQTLFGRYEATRIWAAIGRFTKPEFTTGQLSAVTRVVSTQCSKELGRLKQVGLVRPLSKRGDYVRVDSAFWSFVDQLATEWGHG